MKERGIFLCLICFSMFFSFSDHIWPAPLLAHTTFGPHCLLDQTVFCPNLCESSLKTLANGAALRDNLLLICRFCGLLLFMALLLLLLLPVLLLLCCFVAAAAAGAFRSPTVGTPIFARFLTFQNVFAAYSVTLRVRKLSLNCLFAGRNNNNFDLCRPPGN